MIKEFILGCMALGAVCKHDSEGDSAQQNSIVHIDDSHTELSDSNTELSELRNTLEKAEAKFDQFCTSSESVLLQNQIVVNILKCETRYATREYAEAAYQKSYRQSQKNLTSTLHDMKSRFEKNCEIRKTDVDGDREFKMGRIDSILRQDECHLMYHAIENMKEWMHLRKWSSKSK